METKNLKLVIWDWYLTLSSRHLYEEIKLTNPAAYELIQNYFLENEEEVVAWYSGELGYKKLHQKFAEITGLAAEKFDEALNIIPLKSLIDNEVMARVQKLHELGIRQVIATDNFDVWDEFFLPQYLSELDDYFLYIHTPQKFRVTTVKQLSGFLNEIIELNRVAQDEALLIDDNKDIRELFIDQGGQVLEYSDQGEMLASLDQLIKEQTTT